MRFRVPLLAFVLFALPLVALVDGFAMAPLAAVLFLLMVALRPALAACREAVLPLALLALWPLLTGLWSIDPHASFGAGLRMGVFVLMVIVGAASLRETMSMPRYVYMLPAMGILLTSLVILAEFLPNGGVLSYIFNIRAATFFGKDVNRGLCILALIVWPASACLLVAGEKRTALWLPLLALAMILPLHSLSAKAGCAAAIAVFYAMRFWPKLIRGVLVYGIPLAFVIWPFVLPVVEPWVSAHANIYDRLPESSQHRLAIWHFAFGKWQERPWFGWGADASRVIPGGDGEVRPGWALLPMHPHNLPLQILLEQGVVGYALVATALCIFLRRVISGAYEAAILVAYLAIGMAAFNMWQAWWMATVVIACLILKMANPAIGRALT